MSMISISDEPALPKRRVTLKKWAPEEVDILVARADAYRNKGKRVRWRAIAAETGHHESSCTQKYHQLRKRAADLAARAEIDRRLAEEERKVVLRPPEPRHVPLPVRVQNPEVGVGTSTAKLVMDAQLRARIEVQGITAGLLGDPMPGRSALDKMRAGIVDDPLLPAYHTRFEGAQASRPKITLATGPLR
jgi:hypothetical protein